MDNSCLLDIYLSLKSEDIHMVQFQSVRLCYTPHTVRYKRLEIVWVVGLGDRAGYLPVPGQKPC